MRVTATALRAVRPHLGTLAGLAVLAALLLRLGGRPFLDGVAAVDAPTLLAALGLGAVTTTACAWRWTAVARGAGLALDLRTATADYYRAVFLNAVLPGGVLGDVDRAVRHGRDARDLRRAAAAVAVERGVGLVVLVAATAVWLVAAGPALLPVPRSWVAAGLLVAVVVGAGALVALRSRSRAVGDRARVVVGAGAVAVVLGTSLVALAGFVATFVVAARAAGVDAPVGRVVPLALVAFVAMSLPLNVGGWGPREGAAAWAFGAAGLGAAQGVSASVAFGVCVLVSSLPGAVVLVARRLRPAPSAAAPDGTPVADLVAR
ncbi:lysylphosphatidylglycerol synthase domain-containing protein [Kineosporia sp. A_224]|uniref:lysylphosphatidylglycerol synthase domain-containing protein n=1 Tax=Kineosporia sp. A_224 TaxID=1962180 RepID=UPI000B4B1B48|nr:lysylphosphatidylglycerol synthase domain-containing protein [Kineosporia sp. A_224]